MRWQANAQKRKQNINMTLQIWPNRKTRRLRGP